MWATGCFVVFLSILLANPNTKIRIEQDKDIFNSLFFRERSVDIYFWRIENLFVNDIFNAKYTLIFNNNFKLSGN